MANLFNRAGMSTATSGIGVITLGSALGAVAPNLAPFLSFSAAGVPDVAPVSYLILDANGAWETGWGVTAGSLLSRNPTKSSNSNAAISLSGNAQIFVTARAEDLATIEALRTAALQYNGHMEISQENGTNAVTFVNNTGLKYVVDGFSFAYASAGMTLTGQQLATTSPPFGNTLPQCLVIKATTGSGTIAAGDFAGVVHPIEGYRATRLGFGASGALPITIGFWVSATVAGTCAVSLRNQAATRAYVVDVTINNANTWEWHVVTIPGDTTGTWLQTNGTGIFITWNFFCGSTFQAAANTWTAANKFGTAATTNFFASNNNLVAITGVIVLPGAHQLSPEMSPLLQRPLADDLLIAQRYYEKSYDQGVSPGTINGNGATYYFMSGLASATYSAGYALKWQRKRAIPSVAGSSTATGAAGKARDFTSNVDVALTLNSVGETGCFAFATMNAAGAAINLGFHWVADARL